MRILNADGSEPEMCGNAIRCLAKYLHKVTGLINGPQMLFGTLKAKYVCVCCCCEQLEGSKAPSEYRFFTKAGPIIAEITEDG